MSDQQIVLIPGLARSATEVRLWSTYVLRADGSATLQDGTKIEAGSVIYAGRSSRPEARLQIHLEKASSPTHRPRQAVSGLVHELTLLGIGITLETVAEGLSLDSAKRAEARLIQDLLKSGAPLANTRRLDGGKGGVVNHSARGTPAYNETNRAATREHHRWNQANNPAYREARDAYQREHRATDPEFRNRRLAASALQDLKRGCQVTPRRVEIVTQTGRVEDALAALRSQGRESEWPRDGPME